MTVPEPSALLVRAIALYLPILLVAALALHRRPERRQVAGAVVATAWNLVALLAVNLVAVRAGWWRFGTEVATVGGVPADLWVGWALLWGAAAILASITRLFALAVALVVADLVLMPLGGPVVVLGPDWLIGEASAVAVGLVPGLVLGRWTARGEQMHLRSALQVVTFTGLLSFVLPSLIFTITGEGWAPLLDRPRWQLVLAGVVLAPVGAMAIQAVREFAGHGGTPLPLDSPTALVTSGPYAYVANPMQLAGTILLAAWGLVLASPAVVAAAVMGAAFSAGLAAWSEDRELAERFGGAWGAYRRHVRLWRPSWRPAAPVASVVYVAGSCDPCCEVARFLARRGLRGLEVRAAEACPFPLQRITYQRGSERVAGLAAIGRCLEHASLGWALAGWIGRLPGLEQFLQLIADAVGFGPRPLGRATREVRR